MKLRSYFWVSGAFALLVLLVSCPIDYPIGPQVATPSMQMVPTGPIIIGDDNIPRTFSNAPISITLTSTSGASIYYTLDGSDPATSATRVRHDAPITLTPAGNTSPGNVVLQAIGIKANHPNSIIMRHEFQVFPRVPIGTFSGSVPGTGTGYYGSEIRVTLHFEDGFVNHIVITDFGGLQTLTYWNVARNHAMDFINTMNSGDFDTRTGATTSSAGIRSAVMEAFGNIPPQSAP